MSPRARRAATKRANAAAAVRVTRRRSRRAGGSGPGRSESQGVGPAIGQDLDELFVEEVAVGAHVARDPLLVHLPTPVDVVPETLVEVSVLAALEHRALVVQLDLRDEQAREAAGLLAPLVARREV